MIGSHIKCPECRFWSGDWEKVMPEHNMFSDERYSCPNCGYIIDLTKDLLELSQRPFPFRNKAVWDADRFKRDER